jgi:hypothetical protein
MAARRKLVRVATSKRVFGDAAYSLEVFADPTALLKLLGQKAAWSKGGRAELLSGAVVVEAKQLVSRGDF